MAIDLQQLEERHAAVKEQRRGRKRGSAESGANKLSSLAFGLFIVLIVFTLLSMPTRIPVLGVFRPTVLLVALIALLIFVSRDQSIRRDTSKTTRYLNILIVYILVTIPFVEWPGSVLRTGLEGFAKVVVFFYFSVYLLENHQRLRIFVFTILGCQVFRVLEPLYLHVTTGYWGSAAHMSGGEFMARLSGAPSDIINPNGLAFVILTALPFMHYLLGGSPRFLSKLIYIALLPPMLYAFLLTGSRSGLIGLIVVVLVIVFRSRHKVFITIAMIVSALVLLSVMNPEQRDRYLSITDRDSEHAVTSAGRIDGVMRDLSVGLQRPVFGHGLGTSREALVHAWSVDQISHNLYTEVLIELGLLGLILYLGVLYSMFTNVRQVGLEKRRLIDSSRAHLTDAISYPRLGFYERLANATLAWFVMCLVFSLASYGLSEFYWYMVAGLSVALRNLMSAEVQKIGLSDFPTDAATVNGLDRKFVRRSLS